MHTITACPDISQFTKLAMGQVSPTELDGLLNHLPGCQACVQRLESLSQQDTLVDLIRQSQTLCEGPAAEQVARLVERFRALRPTSDNTPKTPDHLRLACPGCGKGLKVKSDFGGKKIKCPHCQAVMAVPTEPLPVPAERSTPSAPAVADALTLAPDVPAGSHSSPATASGSGNQATQAAKSKELCDFLAPAQASDELGRLGPYRILKVLGSGGMGVVFQAEDPHLQRIVALKAMLPGLATSESAKERFLLEARAAAKLKHDHVVTIHQVGEDRGAPYLAMEFLDGEPLDDRLKREDKLPTAEILRIGREMAEGLAAAHERGLIHRDIKPANVWLEGKRGRVKILDFGLARATTGESHLTQSGAIVGTPAYMAPEQAQCKPVDPRCDLFSLGCVLYRMATGEVPFKGADMISTLMAVSTIEPPPPVSRNLELPTELSDFIMQLLAKNPEERPASAQAVIETLDRIAQDQRSPKPSPAGTQSAKEKPAAPRPTKRRRLAVALVALALLVPLGWWLSGIVVRVESKDGTLVIKTDDPTVGVKVTPEGGATLTYGKDQREIRLKPGKYGIELAEAKEGLKLSTTQLTIASGDNRTIEVVWEKKAVTAVTGTKPGGTVEDPRAPAIAVAPFGPKQARAYQEAWAKYLGKKVVKENSIGIKFVLIPPGKFLMGSPPSAPTGAHGQRERPQHEVEITQPFYLGVFEVTQEQYQAVMAVNPSYFSATGKGKDKVTGLDTADFPVEMVSWLDAVAFCRNLMERSKEAGRIYDLPTEAEWEYACRAGTDTRFSYGSSLTKEQANCGPAERTQKVGSFQPNAFGLHDMHGNVTELCKDWFKDDYYAESPVRDPQGPADGKGHTGHTGRGGNYASAPAEYGSATRTWSIPDSTVRWIGFRVVLRLPRIPSSTETPKEPEKEPTADTKPAPTFKNTLGMEFALVPKGKAWLGGGGGRMGDKEVEFKEDFYLGVYEVTQEEWVNLMGSNPSHFSRTGPGKDTLKEASAAEAKRWPVDAVSWDDAQVFLEKLNQAAKETGWLYRLPTEAEWEYACRGGPMADRSASAHDYYFQKATTQLQPHQAAHAIFGSRKVGSYEPNRLGLYDMHGNVWEWCQDEQLTSAGSALRIPRGGCWASGSSASATDRRPQPRTLRDAGYGLRLARVRTVAATTADPDRRAAEYVLSIGGGVCVNGLTQLLKNNDQLPRGPFQLTKVDLPWNQKVTAHGFANFEGCKHITWLEMPYSPTTDAGIAYFKDCKGLVHLNLVESRVTDAGLAVFKDRPELHTLHIRNNLVTDAGLEYFKDCTKLRVLDIRCPRVTDKGLVLFQGRDLERLELTGSAVTDYGLGYFKDCANLTWLDVCNTQISDDGLAHFKGCKKLGTLYAFGTELTDAALTHLQDCRNLAKLELDRTRVTGSGVGHLKGCNLTLLSLTGTPFSDEHIELLGELWKLRDVRLKGTKVTAAGVKRLAASLPHCKIDWNGGTSGPKQ